MIGRAGSRLLRKHTGTPTRLRGCTRERTSRERGRDGGGSRAGGEAGRGVQRGTSFERGGRVAAYVVPSAQGGRGLRAALARLPALGRERRVAAGAGADYREGRG